MKIKMLVMDVDGTLTDGCIYMGNSGEAMKAFSCKDGYGIAKILPRHGIEPVIITGRTSDIVRNRAAELNIRALYQGIDDKLPLLRSLAQQAGITPEEIAYIGDDLNDFPCMEFCGVVGCPADSAEQVLRRADYVCKRDGGRGAVREFIDWLVG